MYGGERGCRKRPTVHCTVGFSMYGGSLYGVISRLGQKHRTFATVHKTTPYAHGTPPYNTVQCTAVSRVVKNLPVLRKLWKKVFCFLNSVTVSQPDKKCYDQPELKILSIYMDFWTVMNFWYRGFDSGVLKSQTSLATTLDTAVYCAVGVRWNFR